GRSVQRAPADSQALTDWKEKKWKPWAGDANTFLADESAVIAKAEIDSLLSISASHSLAGTAGDVTRIRLWSSKLGPLFAKIGFYLGEGWEKLEKFLQKLRDKFDKLKKKMPQAKNIKISGWKRKVLSLIVMGVKKGFAKLAEFTLRLFSGCITAIVDNAIESFWKKIEDETGLDELKEDFEAQLTELFKPFEEASEKIQTAAAQFEEKFKELETAIDTFKSFVETSAEVISLVGKLEWPIRGIFQAISCGIPPGWGCLWGLIGQVSMSVVLRVVTEFCAFQDLTNRMACKLLRTQLGGWYREKLQAAIDFVGLGERAKAAGPPCDFTGNFNCDLKPEEGCIKLPFGDPTAGSGGEPQQSSEPQPGNEPQQEKKPQPEAPEPKPQEPQPGQGPDEGEGESKRPSDTGQGGKGGQGYEKARQLIEQLAQQEVAKLLPCYEVSANVPATWDDVSRFLRMAGSAGITGDVLRALHHANCNPVTGRYSLPGMTLGLRSPPAGVNATAAPPAACSACISTPPSGGQPPPPGKQKPPPGGGKGQGEGGGGQGQGEGGGGQGEGGAGQQQKSPPPQPQDAEGGKPPEGKPPEGKPPQGKPPEGKPPEGKPPEGEPSEGKPPQGKPPEEEKEKLDWTKEDQDWLNKRLGQPSEEGKPESKTERLDRMETMQGVLQDWAERARQRGDEDTAEKIDGEVEKLKEQIREEQQAPPVQPKRMAPPGGGAGGVAAPPIVRGALRAPGRPLDAATRAFMEPRLGHDLGTVRVHTDGQAAASARAVQARAYTVGRDVVFGAGEFAPETAVGRRLLAHELAHVVQQAAGVPLRLARQADGKETADPAKNSACRIHFVQGRTEFTDVWEFDRCMKTIRAYLAGGGARTVTLHGYASEEGTADFNHKLSQKRADIVRLLLGQGGVPRSRMDTRAHGRDATYPTREENRRVEVVLAESTTMPADEITGAKPGSDLPQLHEPKTPKDPVGPAKPEGTPSAYCAPITPRALALLEHKRVRAIMMVFTEKFGTDTQDLWRTYLDTPKTGTRGTLPKRRLFADQTSRIVKEFREDPETLAQRRRLIDLLATRARREPDLIPPEGRTTDFLPFDTLLQSKDTKNLPMSFGDPANRIPGLIAGGFGTNSSDAGDDVRNVDGKFRITNQGGGTIRIQMQSVFDIFDAVDFCPGNPGGMLAQGITIPLSRLEATPDIPTYDTPFNVVAGCADDATFSLD
ncbi:MAG: DUF4157 domain-containing protein, partial [Anaerolineales bacterium]|nr:DUF4157 domain-containing protein [Anaerolineales bacterium]